MLKSLTRADGAGLELSREVMAAIENLSTPLALVVCSHRENCHAFGAALHDEIKRRDGDGPRLLLATDGVVPTRPDDMLVLIAYANDATVRTLYETLKIMGAKPGIVVPFFYLMHPNGLRASSRGGTPEQASEIADDMLRFVREQTS